jgi:hypothetical protein
VHGVGRDPSKKEDLARCLDSFNLQIICRVKQPATPEEELVCHDRLHRLEADMQHRLCCMSESGGMNLREENIRKRNN